MRVFEKGEPFLNTPAEFHPGAERSTPEANPPTFSEAFLYPTVGREDARFILGVAEEYARIIDILGTEAVRTVLDERFSKSSLDAIRATIANEVAS